MLIGEMETHLIGEMEKYIASADDDATAILSVEKPVSAQRKIYMCSTCSVDKRVTSVRPKSAS